MLLLLVLLIVSGVCLLRDKQDPEPTLEEIVDSKLNAYQTDLADSMDSLKTSRDAAQYLLTWGKNKGISSSIDSHDNVTFTLKPTDDTCQRPRTGRLCVQIQMSLTCLPAWSRSLLR